MKKIFTIIAAVACMGAVFTSCEKDNNEEPKAQQPTDKNFLNTPPTANYTYILDKTESVTITLSQPDYGVGTIPTYAIELSLSPEFNSVPAEWEYTGEESTPQNFIVLPAESNKTTIEIPSRDVADAINGCRGYNKLDQLDEAGYTNYTGPVYMRVRSYFPGAADDVADLYSITSNVITFAHIVGYKTIRVPGYIYLIGAPVKPDDENWVGPDASNAEILENWKLFEADDKIGSQIYSATFDIPADKFQFRFYSALEGWDLNSIGSQDGDSPVDIELNADGVYSGACVVGKAKGEGKGSWKLPGWEGGRVTITVNTKAKTVEFKKVN